MLNFRKKIKKKCGEAFKSKTGEQSKGTEHCNSRCENFVRWNPTCENFRTVRNSLLAHECHFAHLKALFAPCESRCEIHSSMRNKVEFLKCQFRTPLFKVRKFLHRANQGAKFLHSAKLSAKFNLRCKILSFECENFARCNPKCKILSSRCENFAQWNFKLRKLLTDF